MDSRKIPVSVVMMTYEHEKFIAQAVEGVLMQQYEGPVQFIIANDASADRSQEIIKARLDEEIPVNFTVEYTCHEENKGMMTNFAWALRQATGKYTAFCEGDDYWTDPMKLQKQVRFLEDHPEYSLIFSNTALNPDSKLTRTDLELEEVIQSREYRPEEIFEKWTVPFNTVVYRNRLQQHFFDLISGNSRLLFGDIVLFLHLAEQGKIYGMKETTAVYRRHTGNATLNSESQSSRNRFHHLHTLIRAFGSRYATPTVQRNLGGYARDTAWHYYTRGNTAAAIPYLYWALVYDFRETAVVLWNSVRRVVS